MRRSGVTPLSFSAKKDTLKTALPFSLRWQNVTLDFEQDYELDAVSLSAALAPVKNKLPLLRRLRLNFQCTMGFLWEKPLPVTSTCDIFENTPNLRCVTLDYPLCSFKLPFSQLVELKINSPLGLDDLLRCCREATNLESLSTMIDLHSTTHYPSADTTPCHFAKLTYLSIQDLTLPNPIKPSETVPRQLGPLLDKMTCPVLDEMWLNIATKLPDAEYLPTMDSLFRFLRRSPLIKRFTIDDNFKCDDNLIGLLECCPALEEFEVAHDHRGTIGTAFFERLTYREDSSTPTMCPRLRILDLGHRHNLESDESALASAEMVASRWHIADGAPIARLEKLVINCYERECTTRLREFEAEGLEVSLPTLELVRVPKEQEKENSGCTSQ
ncbi:hypothetical protein R3P38DRAFT_3039447 [Favolaschia claudopus]|uniref:Uncharacterized protein n=1 Tax=Favolaschia claudopus TaxID=2862362 RepID=A0AAW0AB70_9AGAR